MIDAFIRSFERGYWQPGDRLPTERECAAVLPVSLGTVQAAFRRLRDAGIVVRKSGVGTHVRELSEREGEKWFLRFLAGDDPSFLPTEILAAKIEETTESEPWTRFLGDRPNCIRIRRLISIGGKFNVSASVYLDNVRFRPLLDFDLAVIGKLHIRQILHDRFNAPTLSREMQIRFLELDDETAQSIGVASGTFAIALDASSYTLRDDPLCFQRFLIPPDGYGLDVMTA